MMFSYSTGTAAKTAATLMVTTTAVMAIGGFTTIYAQNDTQNEIDERLLACADISDTAERMACFDDVVKGLKRGTESPEVADAESIAAPPAPAESLSEVSAPIAAGAAASSIPSASAGATATESSNATPPAAPRDVGSAEASPDSAVEEFGLEDQIARADKKEKMQKADESEAGSVRATSVSSAKSGEYHFVVRLDNGQVWEETDGSRRLGLPRVGMPVEVYKGRFGGYRMKIGDNNRVAWVRRLK